MKIHLNDFPGGIPALILSVIGLIGLAFFIFMVIKIIFQKRKKSSKKPKMGERNIIAPRSPGFKRPTDWWNNDDRWVRYITRRYEQRARYRLIK